MQKKIRAYLINYVNEELKRKKINNKKDILINSTSLDILEKKNMQCKSFLVEENNYFYQQNLDIGWVVGVNFDINSSYHQKPLVNLFANKITKELDKIDSSEIGDEQIEIVNKETIIKKNIDRTLYIHQEKDVCSSLGISLFQKREISERKFNKENNNDFYSGIVSNFMSNKNNKEKGKEESKFKDTNSVLEDNFFLIKRMSNITLETELSRIIKCCHEEDYSSSQERCISESRREEMNKELKMARMYAKKLNLYCKKLKKNVDRNYLRKKTIQQKNQIKNVKTKVVKSGNNNIKNEEIKNSKVKSHIIQRIKYKKIIPKRHSGEEREKNPRIKSIEKKKTKTNKASIDSDKNKKLFESSSHAKENITSRENTNKTKKGLLRLNQFKKRNSSTFRNKLATKLKQVFFKSPKKLDIFKKKKSKQIEGEYKKLNVMHQRLFNKPQNSKKEDEKELTQKIIKMKKRPEHKKEKTSIFRINNKKIVKKSSMVDNFNHTGLDEINIFKTKTRSTHMPLTIKPSKKKSKKKKEKINNNNNNINNNSTSISQRKDTSDSSEMNNINNNKYKYNKKNSAALFKRKDEKYIIEKIKKTKKRRLSHFDNIKIHKIKRISPLKTDREKRNHTTEKNAQKFKKQHELNFGDGEITTDFDDFNHIDEFLYRIKLKRSKNINPVGLE